MDVFARLRRENPKLLVRQIMAELIRNATADKRNLLVVVTDGRRKWRNVVNRELGVYFQGNRAQIDHLADIAFTGLRQACTRAWPGLRLAAVLDSVQIIDTTPSQDEIDNAWEHEIASSESAMKQFYEGTRRTRKGKDLGELRRG